MKIFIKKRNYKRKVYGFPVILLSIALFLTIINAIIHFHYSFYDQETFHEEIPSFLRAIELTGRIIHLDEVLTMSAYMASATGDLKWKKRYQHFEPILEKVIAESKTILPQAYDKSSAQQTETANQALVAMEQKSFALIRENKISQAQQLLFSKNYNEHKIIYSKGMDTYINNIKESIQLNLQSEILNRNIIFAVQIFSLVTLIIAWMLVIKAIRKWHKKLKFSNELSKKTQRQLVETVTSLQQSNSTLERYAYVASHDLKEPLHSVSIFSQMLRKELPQPLTSDIENYLTHIQKAVNRMRNLVDDLLSFSSIRNSPSAYETIECKEILHYVTENLNAKIIEYGVTIKCSTLPTIKVEKSQIIQLFQNIIGNAIKYRKKEITPLISINATPLTEKEGWKFTVEDNGIGIEEEHRNTIFNLFSRLHTKDEYPGTGLGLAICKRIVENHNGEIWATASTTGGSVFHFTLCT